MPDLIHLDQAGFTKGRQAPDATRRMQKMGPEGQGTESIKEELTGCKYTLEIFITWI